MIKQVEDSEILDLKRELSALQKAALLASKAGDYAKSATLAAQAMQMSKAIAREEGLPPFDFFCPDGAVAV
ncbi:MAG: hypothetical protein ACXWBP_00150 [Limisphaerales bacterium]